MPPKCNVFFCDSLGHTHKEFTPTHSTIFFCPLAEKQLKGLHKVINIIHYQMILDGETKVPDLTKYSASNEEGAKLLQKLNDLKGTTLAKKPEAKKKKRKPSHREPGRFQCTVDHCLYTSTYSAHVCRHLRYVHFKNQNDICKKTNQELFTLYGLDNSKTRDN